MIDQNWFFVVCWIFAWWTITNFLRNFDVSWSTLSLLAILWGVLGVGFIL